MKYLYMIKVFTTKIGAFIHQISLSSKTLVIELGNNLIKRISTYVDWTAQSFTSTWGVGY